MGFKKISVLLGFVGFFLNLRAQDCDSNYLSITYTNFYYSNFVRSIVTPQNEIISIGNLNFPHSYMTKYTAQGNVLWSDAISLFFYTGDYYANLTVKDVVPATDSTYFVVGTVQGGLYSPPGLYILGPPNALLINIDKYGHILWSRRFFSTLSTFCFTNIFKMKDGNFIAYMAIDNGASDFGNNGKIVCLTPDGSLKWASYLQSDNYNAAGGSAKIRRAITQTANGNVVVGDVVYRRDFYTNGYVQRGDLHFFALDPDKGSLSMGKQLQVPRACL